MYTSERLKEYSKRIVKELEEKNFKKDCIAPLFLENGGFNQNNWNGGDSIIRQFLGYLEDDCACNLVWESEVVEKYTSSRAMSTVLICNYIYDDDDKVVSIVKIEREGNKVVMDEYTFGWYKQRGRLDFAKANGKSMVESEYIKLLNDIERITDFKFYLGELKENKL